MAKYVLTLEIERTDGSVDWAEPQYCAVLRNEYSETVLASEPSRFYIDAETDFRRMKQTLEAAVEAMRKNQDTKEQH